MGGQRGRIKGPGGMRKQHRAAKILVPNQSLGQSSSEKCHLKNFHFRPAPYVKMIKNTTSMYFWIRHINVAKEHVNNLKGQKGHRFVKI